MQVICLQEDAFYELLDKVVERFAVRDESTGMAKWIDGEEVMNILNIKSKTTLQKLRDEGSIRFSQPQKRIILYDRDSVIKYLEDNVT